MGVGRYAPLQTQTYPPTSLPPCAVLMAGVVCQPTLAQVHPGAARYRQLEGEGRVQGQAEQGSQPLPGRGGQVHHHRTKHSSNTEPAMLGLSSREYLGEWSQCHTTHSFQQQVQTRYPTVLEVFKNSNSTCSTTHHFEQYGVYQLDLDNCNISEQSSRCSTRQQCSGGSWSGCS